MKVRGALLMTSNIVKLVAGGTPRSFSTLSAMKSPSSGLTQKHSSEDYVGLDPAHALSTLKRADAVCFDVDSTVIAEEGIDVLAEYKGQGEKVAELTRQAMGGSADFRSALTERLNLIRPSMQDFDILLRQHPVSLSPGINELIDTLQARGTHVYLVSGGFRQMINSVADHVNIPYNRIYANNILFDEQGNYMGFDSTEPTSSDGGKAQVISMLKDVHGYQTIVMVGDGATDMQAKPPADAFIGYGGTTVRDNVRDNADLYVTSFDDLVRILR